MDRRRYPVSVVPYPIDKAPSFDKGASSRNDARDDNADWDSKWLRPNLNPPSTPAAKVQDPAVPQQQRVAVQAAPPKQSEVQATPYQKEIEEKAPKENVFLRLLHWLFPDVNQRRARRYATPGLVAYYWTGGTAYSYQVGDMSATGLFLLTKEKWAPGTLIQMTLQQREGPTASNSYLCVLSEVVRWGENGTGCNFVLSDYEDVGDFGVLPGDAIDRKSVERFLQQICIPRRY